MRLPFEIAKSAKFPEGKEMSAEEMAEYLAKGGNPEAGKEWKENNDEHQDVVKDKNKEAFQRLLPVERKVAYGPGKKITVKDLEEIGGNMLEGDEDLEALAKQLNSAGGARRVEKAMRDADKILGTHGVEAVFEEGDYDGDAAMTYLNAGDTYAATLVYDVGEDELYVSTWGDWVEWAERKGRQMRASAKKTASPRDQQKALKHALEIMEQVDFSERSAGTPYNRIQWDLIEGGARSGKNLGKALKHALGVLEQVDFSAQDGVEYDNINWRLLEKTASKKTACGPDCSCGGNCMGKCQTKTQEPGTLVWASEQEAEKLQAEAQAAEAQAEADRQKAEAAQLREASDLLPIERMKLGEKYPWDECIADQMKEYGDKETAEKVCGAIRAKSQFGKGAAVKTSYDASLDDEDYIKAFKKEVCPWCWHEKMAVEYHPFSQVTTNKCDNCGFKWSNKLTINTRDPGHAKGAYPSYAKGHMKREPDSGSPAWEQMKGEEDDYLMGRDVLDGAAWARQGGRRAKQELPVELKEHQFTEEDNPNPKGSDKDGDGETNEPSPIKEASAPETVAGWLSWREKSA